MAVLQGLMVEHYHLKIRPACI